MPTGTRLITTPLRLSTSSCAESEIEIDQLTGRRLSSFRGTQPRTPLGRAVEMTATQLPRVRAIPTVCGEPYSVRALTVASAAPPGRRRRTSESVLDVLGEPYRGGFLGTDELARWQQAEPLADSARAVLHVRELARRAVSEGLVFPQAAEIGGEWFAFWGATLEAEIEQTLTRIAPASPPGIPALFHGDPVATGNGPNPRLAH